MVQAARPPVVTPQQEILSILRDVVKRLEELERAVDRIDRGQRPYGDGTLLRRDRA
jgi:actin-like ATPase involved in cell morphogenesis